MNGHHNAGSTEPLGQILAEVAEALGGRDRLDAIKAFHLAGSVAFIGSGPVHVCGHWSCWCSPAQGCCRQVVEIAGGTRFEQVFDPTQGKGWMLSPDNQVRPLTSEELDQLAGFSFLLSGAWLFPDRKAGRVRLLEKDSSTQLLESLPQQGIGCSIRLKDSLPHEIAWLALPEGDPALDSFHSSRIASQAVHAPSAPQKSEAPKSVTRLAEWTQQQGIRIPSKIEQFTGPTQKKLLRIHEFEINPPLGERFFGKPQPFPPVVQFPAGRHSVTVPFRLVDDRTIVDVSVNGQEPVPFFLDTGTSSSLLDRPLAQRLGLKPLCQFSGNIGGGGAKTQVNLVQGVALQIGRLGCQPRSMMVIDIDSIAHRAAGLDIRGILGGSLLRDFVVDLDYEEKKATFFNPSAHSWEGKGEKIEIAVLAGVPFALVKASPPGGGAMLMMVDSGADISLIFTQPFVAKQGLLEKVSPSISTVTFGVGGQTRIQLGRLEEAVLGPICIQRPLAGMALEGQGTLGESGFAGILGAQVLSRLKVRLDYGGGWMSLKPTSRFATPSEYDKSGLALIDKSPDSKRFEVVFVVEGSPADEAGLRKGDDIVSINRRPSGEFSLPELKAALREAGREFEMGVRRSGKPLSMQFVTRKLI